MALAAGDSKVPPGISRLSADQTLELSHVEATHVSLLLSGLRIA